MRGLEVDLGVKVVRWGTRPADGVADARPWAVVVRQAGTRRVKLVGRSEADREHALEMALELRERLAADALGLPASARALPIDQACTDWLVTYHPTLAPATRETADGLIRTKLIPYFGARDLRGVTETDLLAFCEALHERGLSAAVARNALSLLRRVATVAVRAGRLDRNPLAGVGSLVARIARQEATETPSRDSWTPEEAGTLLAEQVATGP